MTQVKKIRQKGSSLVEVLVGVVVFLFICSALFAAYLGMKKQSLYQEELVRFEIICRDIDAYYDAYGADWDVKYFAEYAEDGVVYFDYAFQPSLDMKIYRLEYFVQDGALVVSVSHHETGRSIISDLNYGEANRNG